MTTHVKTVLEMGSKNISELDLAKMTAENSAEEEEGGEEEEAKAKASIRARKRKKLASARGFFQLAETVEKAKWDDEAWRRDFNVSNSPPRVKRLCRLGTDYSRIGAGSDQNKGGKEGSGGCGWGRSDFGFASHREDVRYAFSLSG